MRGRDVIGCSVPSIRVEGRGMRVMRALRWCMVVASVSGFLVPSLSYSEESSQQTTDYQVWYAPVFSRISPQSSTRDLAGAPEVAALWRVESGVTLRGVRGERVPFQIAITAHQAKLDALVDDKLSVAISELRSDRGIIPEANINLFLEHPILVYASSKGGGDKGFYYDALVPLAEPFNLRGPWGTPLRTRVVWAEVKVPKFSPPGIYRGSLTVVRNGARIWEERVSLQLGTPVLPDTPLIKTYLGIFESWLYPHVGVTPDTPEASQLLRRYYDFLYERRLYPWINELLAPRVAKGGDGAVSVSFNEPLLEEYLGSKGISEVVFPLVPYKLAPPGPATTTPSADLVASVTSYVRQVYGFFAARGWQKKLIFNSPIDEPSTKEQYAGTRVWGGVAAKAAPGVKFLATESPRSENPDWGDLRGAVTHFSINGNELARPELPHIMNEERQRGADLSWYASCDQSFPQPNVFIDGPRLDPILLPWTTVRFGLRGFLYWGINFWEETASPWDQPVTFLKGFLCSDGGVLNGEGSLIYPGNQVRRFTGQPDVEGPVSSIRLELLREGLEDADLLMMLQTRGKKELVSNLTRQIVPTIRSIKRDPQLFQALRERLLQSLESP